MINGIKPIVGNTTKTQTTNSKNGLSFNDALDNLLLQIQVSYDNWGGNGGNGKTLDLKINNGRKFLKVIEGNRVWGFVANVDGTHKGIPMLKGDILKAAGWSAPAKHSRGSIFDKDMHESFSWTGPNYL